MAHLFVGHPDADVEHLAARLRVRVVAARRLVAAGEVGLGQQVVRVVGRRLLRAHQQEQQEEQQQARLQQEHVGGREAA